MLKWVTEGSISVGAQGCAGTAALQWSHVLFRDLSTINFGLVEYSIPLVVLMTSLRSPNIHLIWC